MKYVKPNLVTSPRDFIGNVEVIYNGGAESFSLAKIEWEGSPSYAIRWNVARREWDDPVKISLKKECVGMPSSHGYPVWFVIPDEFLDKDSEIWKLLESSKKMNRA